MYKRKIFFSVMVVFSFLVLNSCAGSNLRTEKITNNRQITGSFTVILYGSQEFDSLNTIAFLDFEGDGYELDLFAPEINYEVIRNLKDQEAVEKAIHFISTKNRNYHSAQIRRILNEKDITVGYELRPLYRAVTHGTKELFNVSYRLTEGGRIRVSFSRGPQIERSQKRDSDRSR